MFEEIYFRLVLTGSRTIDEIPEKYRERVQERVDNIKKLFPLFNKLQEKEEE